MPYGNDEHTGGIGQRIAELRAVRGYSLRQLGQRSHVSASMLSMIEKGDRNASEEIVAAVARALDVGVSNLRGQPYRQQLQQDRIDRMIEPLGGALDNWDLDPDPAAPPPRPLADLRADVARTIQMRAAANLGGLAEKLPSLIAEILHAIHVQDDPGHAREELYALQTEAARGVWRVAYRVGEMHLARLALSRMAQAAAQSGDPRQAAVERWMRAQTSVEGGRPGVDTGLRLVNQALKELDDDGSSKTRAVRGALHLKGSILASRQGDKDGSDAWLEEARGMAQETGETRVYELTFGPTNVELHAVAAAADQDKHGLALKRAAKVEIPQDYPPGRAGHFYIDLARAQVWTARHDEAFESLLKARETAPQMTRHHPQVHETAAALRRARARVPDPLREFSLWCGV
ncbi:helix-turn-helix domain-containing protein [Streptomyces yatensis]|uniref:Helix-turn-helix transcriptional regulator n=2 Tax=Streptomyces violaceusniger group TaxID=2839105 RepID=A0ABP4TFN8_9ACTN|nr:helix-turn-helix transcriptional regulator [Streptomyces yatensis]